MKQIFTLLDTFRGSANHSRESPQETTGTAVSRRPAVCLKEFGILNPKGVRLPIFPGCTAGDFARSGYQFIGIYEVPTDLAKS